MSDRGPIERLQQRALRLFYSRLSADEVGRLIDEVIDAVDEHHEIRIAIECPSNQAKAEDSDDVEGLLPNWSSDSLHHLEGSWADIIWYRLHDDSVNVGTSLFNFRTKYRHLFAIVALLRTAFALNHLETPEFKGSVQLAIHDAKNALRYVRSSPKTFDDAKKFRRQLHQHQKQVNEVRRTQYHKAHPKIQKMHESWDEFAIACLQKEPNATAYSIGKKLEERFTGDEVPDIKRYMARNLERLRTISMVCLPSSDET